MEIKYIKDNLWLVDGEKYYTKFDATEESIIAEIEASKNYDYEAASINLTKLAEAKAYLISTDYKVLPDYDGDTTGVLEARAEARAIIRSLES